MKDVEEKQNRNVMLEYIKVIVVTLVITFIVSQFLQISTVRGVSMSPTYEEGDIVVVEKVFYKYFETPSYNDIVIVHARDDSQKYYIKRVIGVPGDCVEIRNGQLYVNDQYVEEGYIAEPMETEDIKYDIPEGKIFVMGDNRNRSSDSRVYGYFDIKEDLIGKVLITLF